MSWKGDLTKDLKRIKKTNLKVADNRTEVEY
jgi:hypothetical protein